MGATPKTSKKATKVNVATPLTIIERINDTMKYQNYSTIEGSNRKLDKKHVQVLVDSFIQHSACSTTIIVLETSAFGKLNRFIADGNHRCHAATELNLPLDIKVVKLLDDSVDNVKKYTASLNNNVKDWTNAIYLDIFSGGDKKEYNIFKEKITTTGLTITDLLFIYTGSGNTKKFQNGDLEFINEKDSDKLLKTILDVKSFVPRHSFVRRGLYFIMKQTQGEYAKMGKAIIKIAKEKASSGLTFSSDEKSFKNELIQIYQKEFGIK
jgi:hypothetical protein